MVKFYLEKGNKNELKMLQDDNKELIFFITLTLEQVNDLSVGKVVGFKENQLNVKIKKGVFEEE